MRAGRRAAARRGAAAVSWSIATAIATAIGCAPARRAVDVSAGPPARRDSTPRFYAGRAWGSEAQFNPLSEIANEGFDILRAYPQFRDVRLQPWARAAQNVLHTLAAPGHTYRLYGVGRAVRHELLPLSTPRSGGGQWLPNYEFHLVGSGMVSARMTEWYAAHGVPAPPLASFATMTAAHFLNEMMENGGTNRYDEDALTDLYVFDLAGFLAFRSTRVQRMFSNRSVQLTNWPFQPTYYPGDHTIQNAGQQFVLRWRPSERRDWRVLYNFGISNQLGVSRDVGGGYAVSLALGADASRIETLDEATGRKGVGLTPSAGVYVDRDGSLLVSLTGAAHGDALASLNVYPGVIGRGRLSPGVWAQLVLGGGVRVGIAPFAGLGLGGRKGGARARPLPD